MTPSFDHRILSRRLFLSERSRSTLAVTVAGLAATACSSNGDNSQADGAGAVNHVVVTHARGDHIGGLEAVMTASSSAIVCAGAADIDKITAPRDIVAVNDGEEIFGLEVLTTPGHIRVPEDRDLANESARSLADNSITTILLGRGGAIDDGGAQLADVIASL